MKKIQYTNYSKLKRENGKLTYSDLLTTTEWREKRTKIIERDKSKCTCCGKEEHIADELEGYRDMTEIEKFDYIKKEKEKLLNSESGRNWMELIGGFPKFAEMMVKKENYIEQNSVILHVHHKYYINGKRPWEYNNNALATVCAECHPKIHKTEKIKIYDNDRLENYTFGDNCSKCLGTGYIDQYHYYHSGICFDCNGKGFTNLYD